MPHSKVQAPSRATGHTCQRDHVPNAMWTKSLPTSLFSSFAWSTQTTKRHGWCLEALHTTRDAQVIAHCPTTAHSGSLSRTMKQIRQGELQLPVGTRGAVNIDSAPFLCTCRARRKATLRASNKQSAIHRSCRERPGRGRLRIKSPSGTAWPRVRNFFSISRIPIGSSGAQLRLEGGGVRIAVLPPAFP